MITYGRTAICRPSDLDLWPLLRWPKTGLPVTHGADRRCISVVGLSSCVRFRVSDGHWTDRRRLGAEAGRRNKCPRGFQKKTMKSDELATAPCSLWGSERGWREVRRQLTRGHSDRRCSLVVVAQKARHKLAAAGDVLRLYSGDSINCRCLNPEAKTAGHKSAALLQLVRTLVADDCERRPRSAPTDPVLDVAHSPTIGTARL